MLWSPCFHDCKWLRSQICLEWTDIICFMVVISAVWCLRHFFIMSYIYFWNLVKSRHRIWFSDELDENFVQRKRVWICLGFWVNKHALLLPVVPSCKIMMRSVLFTLACQKRKAKVAVGHKKSQALSKQTRRWLFNKYTWDNKIP